MFYLVDDFPILQVHFGGFRVGVRVDFHVNFRVSCLLGHLRFLLEGRRLVGVPLQEPLVALLLDLAAVELLLPHLLLEDEQHLVPGGMGLEQVEEYAPRGAPPTLVPCHYAASGLNVLGHGEQFSRLRSPLVIVFYHTLQKVLLGLLQTFRHVRRHLGHNGLVLLHGYTDSAASLV
uniref:Putative mediator of u snrna nuclear export phax n=1 Tax=Ixodes ricinus TaxID=34613 RepID=A0A0K8R9B2_IXORI